MLHLGHVVGVLQEVSQRLHGTVGLRQFDLEPVQVGGDEGIANGGLGRLQHLLHLGDRHFQIP